MFHSVVAYIAIGGYALSFPRYAQHQFAQSASDASLLAVSNATPQCFCFATINFIVNVVQGTTLVGTTLLLLRCIQPRDKSLAFTTYLLILTLFAFIPYPLMYGALTDASCIVWEDRCGERGGCWIYDLPKMRYLINGFTTFLLCLSTFFQCIMTYYCKRIKNFYGDDEAVPGEKPKPIDKTDKESRINEPINHAPSVRKHGTEAPAREKEERVAEESKPPAHESEHN
ncbi:hypothetical protein MRX96_011732 [Rhipicephalus microplus]